MAARGRSGVLDGHGGRARAYVRALPELDRVMMVRADAIATPATAFEPDRQKLNEAIAEIAPGATALRLADAVQFARAGPRPEGQPRRRNCLYRRGAGPASGLRGSRPCSTSASCTCREPSRQLRYSPLTLRRSRPTPESGRSSSRRATTDASAGTSRWRSSFGRGADRFCPHRARLAGPNSRAPPSAIAPVNGGFLHARLLTTDALAGDDQAQVEVPAQPIVRVLVYSDQPELLRPILGASQNVEAVYASPSSYDPKAQARIVIIDRFSPPSAPQTDAIWIDPSPSVSPFWVASTATGARLERWHGENALGAGLGTKDVRLANTRVFTAQPGDLDVADCADGPVILARQSAHKAVAFGFHPALTPMRFELATPLLFANILRWMAPDVFRRWELNGGSAGTVSFALDPEVDAAGVRVLNEGGRPLPFAVKGDTISFFTATPGTVRVLAGNRETVYSLTLPDVADARWQAPKTVLRGSESSGLAGSARKIWPFLALAGALGLILEWMLFGRGQPAALQKESA